MSKYDDHRRRRDEYKDHKTALALTAIVWGVCSCVWLGLTVLLLLTGPEIFALAAAALCGSNAFVAVAALMELGSISTDEPA